jgi:hypothetical protein
MVDINTPLTISIYTDEVQNLIIVNKPSEKINHSYSTGLGLANISAKYKLLNQPDILVKNNGKYFKVTVPLIKNLTA